MITTAKKARTMRCVRDHEINCTAPKCLAWEFYVPEPIDGERKALKDEDKLGYCGLSVVRPVQPRRASVTTTTVLEIE